MNMEDVRAELVNCQSGVETINKIWGLERSIQLKVIVFLWRWWSVRNKANKVGRMLSANEIYSSVYYFLMEFEKLEVNTMKKTVAARNKWKTPPVDTYKINSDGSGVGDLLQGTIAPRKLQCKIISSSMKASVLEAIWKRVVWYSSVPKNP